MIEQNFDYYSRALTYDRFAAFYANVDYTYDRRYSISGTVRYDGSNTMANSSSARWLPTWNISGKWNIGNEAFMKDFVWLDALALTCRRWINSQYASIIKCNTHFYKFQYYATKYGHRIRH